jgi:hypothetical protein
MKLRRRFQNFSPYSNKTLLLGDEFRENRSSESYILLKGVNEFILVRSTSTAQSGWNTMMLSTVSFVKIREKAAYSCRRILRYV